MFKVLGLINYLDKISNNSSKTFLTFENSILNPRDGSFWFFGCYTQGRQFFT
jgi:hypothetical protein